MDGVRFDGLAKRLARDAATRRWVLHGLAAVLGGAAGRSARAGARGAGGRGRCVREKEECRRSNQCCSGRCKGKHGGKRCRRAPGQGTCTTDRDVCRVGNAGVGCNGDGGCACAVTARGTAFCASLFGDSCRVCASGADCVALGFPAGSACIRVGGSCEDCAAEGGTKCVLPC
jgi:hypothetical protein